MTDTQASMIQILRLHTDEDDCVWFGDDDQLAVNSYMEPQDFFDADLIGCQLDEVRCIRFLGTKANAPLVVALQQRRAANPALNKRQRVQLCAPSVVATRAMRSRPEEVLQHLWQPGYSSTLSGLWHDMENSDFMSYSMIANLAFDENGDVPEIVRRIATYHPGWMAVAYLKEYDLDSACRLVTEIVDPRWYRHPFRPHRLTKLFAHLGLTPQNMAAYLGKGLPDRHFHRARMAINTWYNVDQRTTGFVWRELNRARDDHAKGLLKATQRFVSFLQGVWLYGVATTHPEAAFNPEMFFRDEVEVMAFNHFRSSWKAV